jgi:hypothetical protein
LRPLRFRLFSVGVVVPGIWNLDPKVVFVCEWLEYVFQPRRALRQFVARVGREWGGCEECAWMRRFEGGVVYHNPSPSEARTAVPGI